MKVSCVSENLAKGLGIVGRSVGVRSTLPVLSNILLKTEKGGLKLSATDLEVGINTWIGAKVDAPGAITVPAKLLIDYISNNHDKNIVLEVKETSLELKSEHFKVNLKGIDAAEFPLIPEVKKGEEIVLPSQGFVDAVRKTLISVALDESRPVLSGIFFSIKDGICKMVATDSYRLSEQKINLDKKITKEVSFIVPGRPMGELLRILANAPEKITIYADENQVEFVLGETTLVSRLINGSFPDYEQIIPAKTTTQVTVANTDFSRALKMAQIFSRASSGSIKMKLKSPGEIAVIANSPQVGDNTSVVPGEVSGDEMEISFNAKFILDVLNVLSSEKIILDLSGGTSAAQVLGDEDSNYLHLIMPLRTEE